MGYELLSSDFSDFATSGMQPDTAVQGNHSTQIKLASQKGIIQYSEQTLHTNLSIQEGNYSMNDDVRILGRGDAALLEIQFNLSESPIFYQNKHSIDHVTPAQSGNIVFLSADDNEAKILFRKDTNYKTFDVHLPLEMFNRYAGESTILDRFLEQMSKDVSDRLAPTAVSISPAIYQVIHEMKSCRFEGITRTFFLESKVYELIALLCDNIENRKDSHELNEADTEKMHWAASIIRNNLDSPCSIIDLARQVGVNQTKLKTGFKAVMGNTVFGYLQDLRMSQAKQYLLDSTLSIQEISILLGYQNTSNFSAAFKKIHGYSPMKLRVKS